MKIQDYAQLYGHKGTMIPVTYQKWNTNGEAHIRYETIVKRPNLVGTSSIVLTDPYSRDYVLEEGLMILCSLILVFFIHIILQHNVPIKYPQKLYYRN